MRVPARGRKGSAAASLSLCAVAALAARTGWPSGRRAGFADSWGPLRSRAVGELDCDGQDGYREAAGDEAGPGGGGC